MGPYKFVIGTVTDAAREIIGDVGGSVEPSKSVNWHNPSEEAYLVSLPDDACYSESRTWVTQLDGIRTRWKSIDIKVRGFVLVDSASHDDPRGTLDIAKP